MFYIELLKVLPAEDGVEYPRCTNKVKELPKQVKQQPLPNPDDGFEELLEEEDDLDGGFEEGYDDLDLNGLSEFSDL